MDDFDLPTKSLQPLITSEMRDHAKLMEQLNQLEEDVPCQAWPDAYFPEDGGNGRNVDWAKQQCQTCPLVQACADYGIKHQLYHGIWGGLSVLDRRRINQLQNVQLFPATTESSS